MAVNRYPKVLIVSNNSLSLVSNNGRTLLNLFKGWDTDRLAQFCISTQEPDYSVCHNYFMITDREALRAFLQFRKAKRQPIENNLGTEATTSIIGRKRSLKTPTKALLRHVVWSCNRFASNEFDEWLMDFAPDIVLVQHSDSIFILNIALYAIEKTNAKLVMYSSEGYYFFKKNYLHQESIMDSITFPIYQMLYRKAFRRMMAQVELGIYLNSELEKDYKEEFPHKSKVIYTSSELECCSSGINLDKPVFSYLGNFGFNRTKALIEISEVLHSIDSNYYLDVYGNLSNSAVKKQIIQAPYVNYKGFLTYNEVKKVISDSTILFHAECKDEKYAEALKYGFSTKIADSICSGRPFLMYSSKSIAGATYLIETKAGWFAEDKAELKKCITEILTKKEKRDIVLQHAKRAALDNHNLQHNAEIFQKMLCSFKL